MPALNGGKASDWMMIRMIKLMMCIEVLNSIEGNVSQVTSFNTAFDV